MSEQEKNRIEEQELEEVTGGAEHPLMGSQYNDITPKQFILNDRTVIIRSIPDTDESIPDK